MRACEGLVEALSRTCGGLGEDMWSRRVDFGATLLVLLPVLFSLFVMAGMTYPIALRRTLSIAVTKPEHSTLMQ